MRILHEFEWNRESARRSEHQAKVAADIKAERADLRLRVKEAISRRADRAKKPILVEALNGEHGVYVGAYVYLFQPEWNIHEYGIVVEVSPRRFIVAEPEPTYANDVALGRYELRVLSEKQWCVVTAEIARRNDKIEVAKKAGNRRRLTDLQIRAEKTPIGL